MDPVERSLPRWAIAGSIVVVLLAGALILWLRDGSDDDPDDGSDPLALDEGVLDQTTAELVDLSRAGGAGRYHVRYQQSDGSTMELWRSGDDLRQDVVTPEGAEVRVLQVDDVTTRCDRSEGGEWRCTEADEATAPDVLGRLVQDLQGVPFDVEDAEILGVAVRCFASRAGADTGADLVEICFTSDGVLARLAADGEQLEMVALDDEIPADAFDPPAAPTS